MAFKMAQEFLTASLDTTLCFLESVSQSVKVTTSGCFDVEALPEWLDKGFIYIKFYNQIAYRRNHSGRPDRPWKSPKMGENLE